MMDRKRSRLLTVSFLTVSFVLNGLFTGNAFAMNARTDAAQPLGCAAAADQRLTYESIFLLNSNGLFRDSATIVSNRTFQGCWSYFPSGACRAIYSDQQNNYYICEQCGGNGGSGAQAMSGACSRISRETLQIGYWCS